MRSPHPPLDSSPHSLLLEKSPRIYVFECQNIDAFELWCWRRLESPLDFKEIKPVHPKGNQRRIFTGRTDAEAEAPILWPPDVNSQHWKRPWCWEKMRVWREEGDRGWDDWMASLAQWTWVWVSSGSWWWTGEPGMLQSMGSQSRIWVSNWTTTFIYLAEPGVSCGTWDTQSSLRHVGCFGSM